MEASIQCTADDCSNGSVSSANLEAKQRHMLERLQKRQDQRDVAKDRKRGAQAGTRASGAELIKAFEAKFYHEAQALMDLLMSGNQSPAADNVDGRISALKILLSEHANVLAGFQVQKAQDYLDQLAELLKGRNGLVVADGSCGKAKMAGGGFGFARIPPTQAVRQTSGRDSVDVVEPDACLNGDRVGGRDRMNVTVAQKQHEGCVIQGKVGEKLAVTSDICSSGDLLLLDLRKCEIQLSVVVPSMRVRNLVDCTLVALPVRTAILLEDCQNCIFVVGCQQLRVHASRKCTFYLHATSRPIIEASQELKFAPYQLPVEMGDAWAKSGLDQTVNFWDDVQDFDWLVPQTPSPNWSLLNPDEQEPEKFDWS